MLILTNSNSSISSTGHPVSKKLKRIREDKYIYVYIYMVYNLSAAKNTVIV